MHKASSEPNLTNAQGVWRRTSMSVSRDGISIPNNKSSQSLLKQTIVENHEDDDGEYEDEVHQYDEKAEFKPLLRSVSDISVNHDQALAVDVQDPFEEIRQQRRTLDVILVFLVLLFAESARGIVLPTLAPYVESLGGNSVMLGYAVAAFSVGRFASTIGLGYLSTRLSYKVVLAWSVGFCVLGNLIYSFGPAFGMYVMLASRFISGVGAGTLSVARAYVAHVTLPSERTSYMSFLGAVQFLGFAITPGVGSLLAIIPGFTVLGFPVDKYTYPGFFLTITNLMVLALLLIYFKNPPPQEAKSVNPSAPVTELKVQSRTTRLVVAFGVFLALNFLVRCVLGILETLGTPLYIDAWDGNKMKATEAGFVFAGMGLIGVGVLFLISHISRFVSDFIVLVTGLVFLILGCGLMIGDMNLARFIAGAGLIWCIGFPLAQTIIVSMFSKMLGKAPQGTWMGWIGAMGSAGRIVGPIVSGYLYDHWGHSYSMGFGAGMSAASLLLTMMIIPKRKPEV